MKSPDADFFERQVQYLVATGHHPAEARRRVSVVLPEPNLSLGQHRMDALDSHLAGLTAAIGPTMPQVGAAVRAFRSQVAVAFAPVWHAHRALALHLSMLALVAWLLAWLMGHFVLPQMEATYRSFGADLPAATWFVMRWSDTLILPVLFATPAVLTWWLARRARAAVELQRSPVSARFATLLLGSGGMRLWTAYEATLAKAAFDAGLEADAAIDLALDYARGWHGPKAAWSAEGLARARMAGRLGTLAFELAHQREQNWSELPLRAAERREWLALIASLLLGTAVGFYVIALYLPIFKVSSVM
jgi:hypothetical protein